jgi:putative transposon-encoded protein
MVIGQSRCGVVTAAANAPPVGNDDAYTATAGRPLVVPAAGVLANDSDADGQPLTAAKPPGVRPPASGGGNWTFPGEPAHGSLDLRVDGSFTYTPAPGYSGPDSFTYLAQDSRGKSDPATVSLTVAPASRKAVADFDGNGATDLSVFRPASGTWYLQGSPQQNYGASGDIAVPADYDGDGKADVAVFRPSNGVWYVKGSAGTDTAVAFGASGDVPVPADYDGDGKADRAVFRSGVWYVQGGGSVAFGASGDIPVPADYDGDAKADRAVFRSGVWYVKGSAGTDTATAFGTSGDVPVPGDYDGNGSAEVAVFRPSNGVWFVQGGAATAWGTSGDVPVPGDYDGDGDLELAVFRPSNGVWFVQGGATTAWGATGDVPLPLPAAVHRSAF